MFRALGKTVFFSRVRSYQDQGLRFQCRLQPLRHRGTLSFRMNGWISRVRFLQVFSRDGDVDPRGRGGGLLGSENGDRRKHCFCLCVSLRA